VINLKNTAFNNMLEHNYGNLIDSTFSNITRNSRDQAEFLQTLFESFDESVLEVPFPRTKAGQGQLTESRIGNDLKAAFKTIALREQLGLRRQTIFVEDGGFDTHLDLLSKHSSMFDDWSQSIYAFQSALDQFGLQDSVITFVASDFGRTLRSNGRGTDHAWGGNTLVFGGPVNGGRVHGTFPNLDIGGPDDVGLGGWMLPTTSIDEFYAEMLQWFGVSNSDLPYVLPNIENFYSIGSGSPIGFLKPEI
jgi:uncharacterized protein (DUF1501 family)